MSHTEDKTSIITVGKAHKLAADALISARFVPKTCGKHYREFNLLAAYLIHLVAKYILDFTAYTVKRCILRINTASDALHISAAQHQRMAVNNAVGRLFFESLAYELIKFHT